MRPFSQPAICWDIVVTADTCSGSASVSGQIIDSGGGIGRAINLANGGVPSGWKLGPLLIHHAPEWSDSTAIVLSPKASDILIEDVRRSSRATGRPPAAADG